MINFQELTQESIHTYLLINALWQSCRIQLVNPVTKNPCIYSQRHYLTLIC